MSYSQTEDTPIIYEIILRNFAFLLFLGEIWDDGVKISRSIYSMLTKFGGIVPPAKRKVTCYNLIISYIFTVFRDISLRQILLIFWKFSCITL